MTRTMKMLSDDENSEDKDEDASCEEDDGTEDGEEEADIQLSGD
jgi:hypothetical protein